MDFVLIWWFFFKKKTSTPNMNHFLSYDCLYLQHVFYYSQTAHCTKVSVFYSGVLLM